MSMTFDDDNASHRTTIKSIKIIDPKERKKENLNHNFVLFPNYCIRKDGFSWMREK